MAYKDYFLHKRIDLEELGVSDRELSRHLRKVRIIGFVLFLIVAGLLSYGIHAALVAIR